MQIATYFVYLVFIVEQYSVGIVAVASAVTLFCRLSYDT